MRRRRWPYAVVTLVIFGVGLGACLAGINNAVNQLNAEQRAHAITPAQFDAVTIGASEAQVIASLGKQPEDAQQFVQAGVLTSAQVNSSCIYYNKVGDSFGSRYQFCFTNGALDAKNSY